MVTLAYFSASATSHLIKKVELLLLRCFGQKHEDEYLKA